MDETQMINDLEANPFERIGLGLSGGGFRAAAFHLGAMNLMHVLGLMEKVNMISTVSGGTFPGALYALYLKESAGEDPKEVFREFYYKMLQVLQDDSVLDRSLEILEKNEIVVPSGRRTLILAFAQAYNELIFDNALFGTFWDTESGTKPEEIHLKEIIFNSTEFYSGVGFRFQKSQRGGKIGNGNVNIPQSAARHLRLADVVAASSCFPAGFEPMIYPGDFHWETNDRLQALDWSLPEKSYESEKASLTARDMAEGFALMDGGIVDNQGIGPLLLANEDNAKKIAKIDREWPKASEEEKASLAERREQRQPSSMILISDVASAGKNLYDIPPIPDLSQGTRKMRWIGNALRYGQHGMLLGGIAVFVNLLVSVGLERVMVTSAVFELLLGTGLLVGSGLLKKINKMVDPEGGFIKGTQKNFGLGEAISKAIFALRELSVNQVADMASLRGTSVVSMVARVFLKSIRSQRYAELYRSGQFKGHVVSNILGNITRPKEEKIPHALALITRVAKEMPTTLWFKGDRHRLQALMIAGEINLCRKIILFIEAREEKLQKEGKELSPEVRSVYKKAQWVWDRYCREWSFLEDKKAIYDPCEVALQKREAEQASIDSLKKLMKETWDLANKARMQDPTSYSKHYDAAIQLEQQVEDEISRVNREYEKVLDEAFEKFDAIIKEMYEKGETELFRLKPEMREEVEQGQG